MSGKTKISWADSVWNPTTGCTEVSPGCDNCYAREMTKRFRRGDFNKVVLHPERLTLPLTWRTPRRIFVDSMSDLFHKDIPDSFLVEVWLTMLKANWHTYIILSKRPERMRYKLESLGLSVPSRIWLGTSVENQKMAESRIPSLLSIPIKTRVISAEPLLGKLDLWKWLRKISWTICGGESGPHRRPMELDWVRKLRDDCLEAHVPFVYKQASALRPGMDRELDGRTWEEYP